MSMNIWGYCRNSIFCMCGPMSNGMSFIGSSKPAASIAFQEALCWFTPKHATSPVDCTSTPKRGSEFFGRPKEKLGTLVAM